LSAREVAVAVVRDVFPPPGSGGPERNAQESLEYRARRAKCDGRDRAFATELAYGTIKMRRAIDWYLEPFVGSRDQPLPPAIREILRVALYELLYTNADVHATVFEFVNLAKKLGHRGVANLVNAVLRTFLRERPGQPARESFESDDEYLATRYSYPTWLVRQWRGIFGERLEEVCDACNGPARTAIVVDTARATRDAVAGELELAGIVTRPSEFVPDSLLVESGVHELFARARQGAPWWLQSESSAMPVDILNPQPGEAVLDACSGRGNKALQIGARLAGDGSLICIDRDARKTEVLASRLEAAGLVAGIVLGDATAEILEPQQRFDRILVDAPCSGVGVVGRHPEARWKKQGTDGERLAITQRALLERLGRQLHPGGVLVYAVCSTDPRETTEVLDWFLARDNFTRGLIPSAYAAFLTDRGDVLVPPGVEGRDGFYIARLERGA
jgi:16S rRNA (cytosine967-C5)-methyltransferase